MVKFMKRNKTKLNYQDLIDLDIEKEIAREKYKSSFTKILINTLFILLIILAIGSIVTTIFMPVVEVTSSSMKPIINDGNFVLNIKKNNYKIGDIISFYHGNKILIKRVIGLSGDFINIDIDGNVYVNGELLNISNVTNLKKGNSDVSFPIQVPENSLFVLSDDRYNMFDSRNSEIGFISKSDIIGKIILKIYPLNEFRFI